MTKIINNNEVFAVNLCHTVKIRLKSSKYGLMAILMLGCVDLLANRQGVFNSRSDLYNLIGYGHKQDSFRILTKHPVTKANKNGKLVGELAFMGIPIWGSSRVFKISNGLVEAPLSTVPTVLPEMPFETLIHEEKAVNIAINHAKIIGKSRVQSRLVWISGKYRPSVTYTLDGNKPPSIEIPNNMSPRIPSEKFDLAYEIDAAWFEGSYPRSMKFLVNAVNGNMILENSTLKHGVYKNRNPLTLSSGIGYSQYNGTVALSTLQGPDVFYKLIDNTRLGNGGELATQIWDPSNFFFDGRDVLSDTNIWGDGGKFSYSENMDPFGLRGQTAAVDAHFSAQATLDFYHNVFDYLGVDGVGGSIKNLVHFNPDGPYFNASWVGAINTMVYGDGAQTGALTTLDVGAHELSHGVMQFTAGFDGGEASGLNEANSDVMSMMVSHYTRGVSQGQGNIIPNSAPMVDWTIGSELFDQPGAALRSMIKPSLDGKSFDYWYDGIGLEDPHFSMGPANRMFYFLSQGSSSNELDIRYTPFLPNSMSGIGNDKAAKIWFNTITSGKCTPSTGYQEFRNAMIDTTVEMYGLLSVETAAVKNAFSAIGVGDDASGEPRIQIFIKTNPISNLFYGNSKFFIFPSGVATKIPEVEVVNGNKDLINWEIGGLGPVGTPWFGLIDRDFYIPPNWLYCVSALKVSSKQDPKRFAVALTYSTSFDCDADCETDAIDMGVLALAWGTSQADQHAPFPTAILVPNIDSTPSNLDCSVFLQGFFNAFVYSTAGL